jgi:hypothetical protein
MTFFLEFSADGVLAEAAQDELVLLRGDDYDGERVLVLKSTETVIARKRVRDSIGAHYVRSDELDEGMPVFHFVNASDRGRLVRRSKEMRMSGLDRTGER